MWYFSSLPEHPVRVWILILILCVLLGLTTEPAFAVLGVPWLIWIPWEVDQIKRTKMQLEMEREQRRNKKAPY